ncbi:MAG: YfiR/HmsC family protein [Candidatus Sericytochromatia bacterium]
MRKLLLFTFIISTLAITPIYASDNDVPLDIQVNILLKTISYCKNISDSKITIGIVFDPSSTKSVRDKDVITEKINLLKKEQNKTILTEHVNISNYTKKKYDILYFTKGLNQNKIKNKTTAISWGSDPEYVKQGLASLSVLNKNNRAKIFINMKSLEYEGHSISSQLLKLAQIE